MNEIFNNIYKDKTILITGDTGFKGSWLTIWLLKLGANVIGYSLPPKTEKDNFIVCNLKDKITHIEGDIRDYNSLLNVFKNYNPEIVFHLAAQPLVLDSYKDPITTYSTNIMGTVNIFECSRKTPSVKVVVNITSDKCYENNNDNHTYKETDQIGGRDPYSASKGCSELITSSYLRSFFSEENTANIASVRAGNVIGGGDWSENRIVPDCMRALSNGKTIILRNPYSTRPWQHVLEPLSGYLTLGSLLYTKGKEYSGAYNFSPETENNISVEQLVKNIIVQCGRGRYVFSHEKQTNYESNYLCLDSSKSANLINWHPKLNIEETIKYVVEEYSIDYHTNEEIFAQRLKHIENYISLKDDRNKQ